MLIAGFNKTSLVDFPGKICAVVFTPYCNMRCSYCHNLHLLSDPAQTVDEAYVFEYLQKRRDLLQGVVVTGGEPTMRPNLPLFLHAVKEMGFQVKLDTNGSNPQVLRSLARSKLIDYVAMDVKAPLDRYEEIAKAGHLADKVEESLHWLQESGLAHEFRTTFCPQLSMGDIMLIGQTVFPSPYFLQQYRVPAQGGPDPHPASLLKQTQRLLLDQGISCTLRGVD